MDKDYWDAKWKSGQTGWDTGEITPPIRSYIDQIANKQLKILIPGGGNGYEAEYLFQQGYKDVFLLDVSEYALKSFKERFSDFPEDQLVIGDFFSHTGQYDLIVEQTFFCALDPSLREAYVEKTAQLLKPGGKLIGLLWSIPLPGDQPPYGGTKAEYQKIFSKHFILKNMSIAHNSIPSRAQKELFINFKKK